MDLKDLIRQKRVEHGWTMKELADKIGVSEATISRWESGEIENMKHKGIVALSSALGVTPNAIMGWEDEEDSVTFVGVADVMKSYKFIPSSVSAGSPENIEGQNYQQISIPSSILGKYADCKDVFIMRVNGDSMNCIIPDGSLVGILPYKTSYDIKDGDIVVFNDESYNYSVKRYYKVDNTIIFKPESTLPTFMDISYDLEEESVEIIGKVIMYNVVL